MAPNQKLVDRINEFEDFLFENEWTRFALDWHNKVAKKLRRVLNDISAPISYKWIFVNTTELFGRHADTLSIGEMETIMKEFKKLFLDDIYQN